jgi:Ricin-type beta-trefoil lectin domain
MNKLTLGLLTGLVLSYAAISIIPDTANARGSRLTKIPVAANNIRLSQAGVVNGLKYHSLKTNFTGDGKCLDVVNDGTNNKLQMADCGNFSGQFWNAGSSNVRGYVRLRNQFTGSNKCLDVVNDGTNNQLQMADCGNFSGQVWSIVRIKKTGFYRMRNQFTGSNKCLDIVNDGTNNQLQMADCGNFSGQNWQGFK